MTLVLYTDLKYVRIDCFGVSILRYTDEINPENYPRVLPYPKPEEDEANKSRPTEKYDDIEKVEVKFELDVEYLKSLDPKAWKDQDHYAVLGLKNSR